MTSSKDHRIQLEGTEEEPNLEDLGLQISLQQAMEGFEAMDGSWRRSVLLLRRRPSVLVSPLMACHPRMNSDRSWSIATGVSAAGEAPTGKTMNVRRRDESL